MSRLCPSRTWLLALSLLSLTALALTPRAFAGTDSNGFFDEYLTLSGPINNNAVGFCQDAGQQPGFGAAPGIDSIRLDRLCEGEGGITEETIIPAEGLMITPNAGVDGCAACNALVIGGTLTIVKRAHNGNVLDFNAFLNPNDNVMAYSWVYVNNVSGGPLPVVLGVASDDSIQAKLNRQEVIIHNGGRGSGGAGTIQNSASVILGEGYNLLQFKVFEGGGGFNMRARLQTADACPDVFTDGDGLIEVTTDLPEGATIADFIPAPAFSATRTIATTVNGMTVADVTVDVTAPDGADFTLTESFDSDWMVEAGSVTGDGVVGNGSITWMGTGSATVSYTLTRSGDFLSPEGVISGQLIGTTDLGIFPAGVGGDNQIAGGQNPFVDQMIVGPSFILTKGGCDLNFGELRDSNWLAQVGGDEVIPEDGLIITPDYEAMEFNGGVRDNMSGDARGRFLADPANLEGDVRFAVVSNTRGDGLFDWQHGSIYGADINNTYNSASFYVEVAEETLVRVGQGTDDATVTYVNNMLVDVRDTCRGHPGFGDKFWVRLSPGKNLFTVFTYEQGGGYNMCHRFENADGEATALATTVDPAGYPPAVILDPVVAPEDIPPGSPKPIYTGEGGANVSEFLYTFPNMDQPFGSGGVGGSCPENFLRINGEAPSVDNVFEGAIVTETKWFGRRVSPRGAPFGSLRFTKIEGADNGFNGESFYSSIGTDNYTGSIFFFIENTTGEAQTVSGGFSSDDSGWLYFNGNLVAQHVGGRGWGGVNAIQNQGFGVLEPGVNLVQGSWTEGGGGSGMRIGIHERCPTTGARSDVNSIDRDGNGEPDFIFFARSDAGAPIAASRSIAFDAGVATVTVDVDAGGADYELTENYGFGWTVTDDGGGTVDEDARTITIAGNADTVSYSLGIGGAFTDGQAGISGKIESGGVAAAVTGDSAVPGAVSNNDAGVPELLVTPSLAGSNCNGDGDGADLNGDWGGFAAFAAANTIEENAEVTVDFANVPGTQWDSTDGNRMSDAANDRFLVDPADATGAGRILKVAKTRADGFYDWQAGSIYGSDVNDTMNAAFWYVENNTGGPVESYWGMGSDDSLVVYVNGVRVHSRRQCRGHPGFSDKICVTLPPGKSLFQANTYEGGGGYNFCARQESPDGTPIVGLPTTTDPAGYDRAAVEGGTSVCPPAPAPPTLAYTDDGIVTVGWVTKVPHDQPSGAGGPAGVPAEAHVTNPDGGAVGLDDIFSGALVGPGDGGNSTAIRNCPSGLNELIPVNGGGGDPGLINGESLYGGRGFNTDNYNGSAFFILDNKTDGPVEIWPGFASDDSGWLYVNGQLVAQHIGGRGFGGANQIQNATVDPVTLNPGLNHVQLSWNEGGGGSGVRFGYYADACLSSIVSTDDVAPISPEALGCPAEGDTHVAGIAVTAPENDRRGSWGFTADSSDDNCDPILHTFTATPAGGGDPITIANAGASVNFDLTPGDWTISVTADDDPNCPDAAADATATVDVTVTEFPACELEISCVISEDASEISIAGMITGPAADCECQEVVIRIDGAEAFRGPTPADGMATLPLEACEESVTVEVACIGASAGEGPAATCTAECPGGRQVPGDCNQDAEVNISDPICHLGFLFLGDPDRLPCGDGSREAAGNVTLLDWNGDAVIDLSDAVGSLNWQFSGGPPHVLDTAGDGSTVILIGDCPDVAGVAAAQ